MNDDSIEKLKTKTYRSIESLTENCGEIKLMTENSIE